jgi:EAL domain-containing protein (putative c-di-GMP-specific phosphodiesterase class I)
VYQPIIDLERVRIYGFEALLRWNRPGKGPVAPETFITVAEETGLVIPLGLWVLNEACRQLSAWRRKQTIDNDICVSVNVSKRQLAAPGFCEDVSTALSLHQILPTRLNLEITESAIIDAPDQVEA